MPIKYNLWKIKGTICCGIIDRKLETSLELRLQSKTVHFFKFESKWAKKNKDF
jgi:hypothetical protein